VIGIYTSEKKKKIGIMMVTTFIACHCQGNITHHRETLKQHDLDVKIITFFTVISRK